MVNESIFRKFMLRMFVHSKGAWEFLKKVRESGMNF